MNGGSLAEKAGLCVGDNLIRVNSTDIYQMRHKEAQDTISRAGNNFELVVSRFFLISTLNFSRMVVFSLFQQFTVTWLSKYYFFQSISNAISIGWTPVRAGCRLARGLWTAHHWRCFLLVNYDEFGFINSKWIVSICANGLLTWKCKRIKKKQNKTRKWKWD